MDLHADAGKPVKYRAGSPFSDLESIFFQIFLISAIFVSESGTGITSSKILSSINQNHLRFYSIHIQVDFIGYI